MSAPLIPAEDHLLTRFRQAAASIRWRELDPGEGRSRLRIAHLHDEEVRLEERTGPTSTTWSVDAGPLGALVILLEVDRRGERPALRSFGPDARPGFPQGGISAEWSPSPPADSPVPLSDLVALARYALV